MIKIFKGFLGKHKTSSLSSKYKSVATIIILITGIFIVFFYAGRAAVNLPLDKVVSAKPRSVFIEDEQVMLNGHSWKNIENLDISDAEKFTVKTQILKITLESSLFSGTPVITPSENIAEYVLSIDRFYADNDNRNIPVFFALKIADLAKNNMPEFMISSYRNTIKEKLKEIGIIQ
jgi:hypothetical protein